LFLGKRSITHKAQVASSYSDRMRTLSPGRFQTPRSTSKEQALTCWVVLVTMPCCSRYACSCRYFLVSWLRSK